MTQILVRNLDETVIEQLKKRAKLNRRSLQAEVQVILEAAARSPSEPLDMAGFLNLAQAIRSRTAERPQTDSAELVREDRER